MCDASPALPALPRDRYHPTWHDAPREATLSVPRTRMQRAHFSVGLHVRRSRSRGETTDHRHGDERQRHSRYGACAPCESHHRHQRIEKKEPELQPVNHAVLQHLQPDEVEVEICRADELEVRRGLNSELDEMWSFVKAKAHPRWLWHAIDHHTGKVLAYVFGRRKDEVFLRLQTLLEPFGLTRYYTDHWGAYTRHLDPDVQSPGKRNTQKIERKHLTLRTRIKRLVRKTICFSKTIQMHDIVLGLFVNRYAFGLLV